MDEFLDSFVAIESWLKMGLLIGTYRYWGPVLKTIVAELRLAMLVPRGSLLDREPPPAPARPRGDDPWVHVPLARHRTSAERAPGRRAARASAPLRRRGGFR